MSKEEEKKRKNRWKVCDFHRKRCPLWVSVVLVLRFCRGWPHGESIRDGSLGFAAGDGVVLGSVTVFRKEDLIGRMA